MNYRANFVYPLEVKVEFEADNFEDAETKCWKKLEQVWKEDHEFVTIIDILKGAIGEDARFHEMDLIDIVELEKG